MKANFFAVLCLCLLRLSIDVSFAQSLPTKSSHATTQGITKDTPINAKSDLEKAETELLQLELQLSQAGETQNKQILEAQIEVLRKKVEIEANLVEFSRTIDHNKDVLKLLRQQLTEASKPFLNEAPSSSKEIEIAFGKTNEIWETAVDQILRAFTDIKISNSAELPSPLVLQTHSEIDKEQYQRYLVIYENIANRIKYISELKVKLLNDLKAQNFKLLNEAGAKRARLIRICDGMQGCHRETGLNEKNIKNIIREVRVLPLKFMGGGLNKWLEIKAKLTSGFDGWVDLIEQSFILFLLILVPFLIARILNWLSQQLDLLKTRIITKSLSNFKKQPHLALWIARINPFLPSIGMILSVHIARRLLESTDLREFSGILFYLEVYFIYRAARLLLKVFLEVMFSTDSVDKLKDQKTQIEKTARQISRIVFFEYALLHLIEDTVRRALVYNLISNFIFWINIFIFIFESSKWRVQIYDSFRFRFPRSWIRLKRLYSNKIGYIFIPFLIFAVTFFDIVKFVSSHLIRLDIVKRLLSEVLRRRLEKAEKESKIYNKPSEEYLSIFDYYLPASDNIFVAQNDSIATEASQSIQNWKDKISSNNLNLIVGNRGMGKSTILKKIFEDLLGENKKIYKNVSSKLLSQNDLLDWLSKIFEQKFFSHSDFLDFDKNLTTPYFLFIDDIHNLFLSSNGGFEAYSSFIQIVNLNVKNIFWCLTINSRSWSYLRGIFGKEHFSGAIYLLKPWADFEIQKLILARHETIGYQRTFDEAIRAYSGGDSLGQQAEAQFFRLLWSQSRGNPRAALMYWVSAISSPSPKHIHVGIPTFVNSSLVASMSDDALFLLAAIAKHEYLSESEMNIVTGIDANIIRKCIKEAIEKNLIWSDDSERIRISSKAQYVIDYYLIGKNFLYE